MEYMTVFEFDGNNPNVLIAYGLAALVCFYFIEKLALSRILTYIAVLTVVAGAANYKFLYKLLYAKLFPSSQKQNEKQTTDTMQLPTPSFKIKSQLPELGDLQKLFKTMEYEHRGNPQISADITDHANTYMTQVITLMQNLEDGTGHYTQTFQNIRDTAALLHSTTASEKLASLTGEINVRLDAIINADFKRNLNCTKSPSYSTDSVSAANSSTCDFFLP